MAIKNESPTLQRGWLRLPRRRALRVGAAGGRLEVATGRVWLTLAGQRQDFFVDVGQGMVLRPGDDAVVESIGGGEAILNWQPDQPAATRVASRPSAPLRPAAAC